MDANNNIITPSLDQIKDAYAAATTEESKNILRALYGDAVEEQDNRPITERVKTLTDAISILGGDHPYVKQLFLFLDECLGEEEGMTDIHAYLKLRIITAALNEGWEPEFTEDEDRWAPWFYFYTKEKLDEKSEDWKQSHTILPLDGRVVGRSNSNAVAYCCLVFANASGVLSWTYTNSSARLTFKSRELAEYAGRQFIEIYADLLI